MLSHVSCRIVSNLPLAKDETPLAEAHGLMQTIRWDDEARNHEFEFAIAPESDKDTTRCEMMTIMGTMQTHSTNVTDVEKPPDG